MKILCVSLSLLFIGGCASRPSRNDLSGLEIPGKNYPIIDAHTHFHSEETGQFNNPPSKLVEEFQKLGIGGGVVHYSKEENFKSTVRRTSSHQWMTCAGLFPPVTVRDVEKGIQEQRFQCLKIYLGYVPKWAYDSFYQPFYKLAEKYKIPVVFHTGDTYKKDAKVKYADPLQIDEVAVEYPKIKFVIAHVGNPWFQSAAEVVYKNDNVYVDVSAIALGDVSKLPQEESDELIVKPVKWVYAYVENPKKFLFGSDWPLVEIGPYIELMKKVIPPKDWKMFFNENAKSVFGFK